MPVVTTGNVTTSKQILDDLDCPPGMFRSSQKQSHRAHILMCAAGSTLKAAELIGMNRTTLMRVACQQPVHRATLVAFDADIEAAEAAAEPIWLARKAAIEAEAEAEKVEATEPKGFRLSSESGQTPKQQARAFVRQRKRGGKAKK